MRNGALMLSRECIAQVTGILELVVEYGSGLTANSMAWILGEDRKRMLRLLAEMERHNLIELNGNGGYVAGPLAIGLANRLLSSSSIISHARPVLEQLAVRHGETAYLTVLRGDEVIFLDGAAPDSGQQISSFIGRSFPSLATSAGKAIRALQSSDLLKGIFGRRRSLDMNSLQTELEQIRCQGFAIGMGIPEDGITSAAAAVRDYAGKVVCALTVQGPSVRMAASRIEEIVPSLKEGAEFLSSQLGYAKLTPA